MAGAGRVVTFIWGEHKLGIEFVKADSGGVPSTLASAPLGSVGVRSTLAPTLFESAGVRRIPAPSILRTYVPNLILFCVTSLWGGWAQPAREPNLPKPCRVMP